MLSVSEIFRQLLQHARLSNLYFTKNPFFKTAFTIDNDHYEFLQILSGSLTPLEQYRSLWVKSLCTLFLKVYLDDILIHSTTRKSIVSFLKNLDISMSKEWQWKTKFFRKKVLYWGKSIWKNSIMTDICKIDAMKNWKKCKNSMRVFVLMNWFGPYIPNLDLKNCSVFWTNY